MADPAVAPPPAAPSVVTAPDAPVAAPPPAPETSALPPESPKLPEPAKAEPPPAPVSFAGDKLTLPEGMKADDPNFKSFSDIMSKDLDPQARGQALIDLYGNAVKQARDAGTEAWNNVNKGWTEKTLADPEIGGAKFPAAKATIAKAIDGLGPNLAAEVRQALDVTGAGNHPAIVKALHAFASRLTEPGHVSGNPPGANSPKSIKEAFYPNSPDMK